MSDEEINKNSSISFAVCYKNDNFVAIIKRPVILWKGEEKILEEKYKMYVNKLPSL